MEEERFLCRGARSVMMVDLPEELLLYNILALLPIGTLLRFRSVCKKWNSFVRDPRFQEVWASIRGGEHALFYDEFINHVVTCFSSRIRIRRCDPAVGDFLLLRRRLIRFSKRDRYNDSELLVVSPGNAYLKKISWLDFNLSSTGTEEVRRPDVVGMVVLPGTKNYSIFVASKTKRLEQSSGCYSDGPIFLHQYDSTQDAWSLFCEVPLVPMEIVRHWFRDVVMHHGALHFLVQGRYGERDGVRKLRCLRVPHCGKQYRHWEDLTEGFPTSLSFASSTLFFEHNNKLFLTGELSHRYTIWQYKDEVAKWELLYSFPEESSVGPGIRYYAHYCGNFLYVMKQWRPPGRFPPDTPRRPDEAHTMMYNSVDRQHKLIASVEVVRKLLQVHGSFRLKRCLYPASSVA